MDRETLRKVQLVQLEIVKEIKRVCNEAKIDYFLDSGTLLGAVRHRGFIPWDDDLDIGMLRKDYDMFLEMAPKYLNERYEIIDWKHEKGYPHPMAKVIKKGTVYVEEKRKDDSKQGIWVDVFAYDKVPDSPKIRRKQGRCIMLYRGLIRAKCKYQTWHVNGVFLFGKWLKNLPLRIFSLFFSKESLVKKYEEAARLANTTSETMMYFANGSSAYGKWFIPSSCFEKLINVEFEDDVFRVPRDYDLYLKTVYGDYMKLPPENERENRHGILTIDFGEEN